MANSESRSEVVGKMQLSLRVKRTGLLELRNSGFPRSTFPSSADEAISDATRRLQEERSPR